MMMKRSWLWAAAAALTAASVFSAEPKSTISKREALKAIATFNSKPDSEEGRVAGTAIVTFAYESDLVEVVLSPSVLPWTRADKNTTEGAILVVAYTAGNVKAQLDRGAPKNDSYAGVLQVLKTYGQLQKTNKALKIREIERFKELEAKKELKKFVEEGLKRDARPREESPLGDV